MAVSRNRLFAGFGNNVVDNLNSVTLDSAHLVDNATLYLGTDDDMSLYHNGSHLFAYNNTGNMYFRAARYAFSDASGNIMLDANDGTGAVKLYYNHSQRMITTVTGIDVTGDINVDSITLAGESLDSAWVAARSSAGGASVTVSASAPSSPSAGDLWYDEENGFLLLYYTDSDTSQWVQAAGGGQNPLVQEGDSSWSLAADLTVSGGLTVTGDAAAANFNSTSDARLKDNIETINNAIDKVSQLRGVSYDKDGRRQIGVIAQETELVIPEVVMTNDDGFKTVAYGNIVGLLIEAVKDLQMQVDTLKEQINGGD